LLLFSAVHRVFDTMCVPGPDRLVKIAESATALLLAALCAAGAAWASSTGRTPCVGERKSAPWGVPAAPNASASWRPEGRPLPGFCYVRSKFPESPAYRHCSPRAPFRPLPFTVERQEPPRAAVSLFATPPCPECWLGVTSESEVQRWMDYYVRGAGRSYLAKAIERSATYIRAMERIVRDEGLPPEVLTLVFIESGFDMRAVSRKRAAGPWQLMPKTAKRFGLHVGRYLDERRDFELSTRAAARYLKYLYGLFDSWPLAVASYNSGEGRVMRAIERQKTRDFHCLRLPRQTREFVPKAAAVLRIIADPARYGFSVPPPAELDCDIVEVNGPVRLSALASIAGIPMGQLERLNPGLVRGITPPGSASFPLRVPAGAAELCAEELSKVRSHLVARGETLSRIASIYGVSVKAIARANGIRNPNRIREGVLLTIPPLASAEPGGRTAGGSASARAGASAAGALASAAAKAAKLILYTVKPGDSLWRIGAMFRTSVSDLAKWNGLYDADRIRPGQVLKVFVGPSDKS